MLSFKQFLIESRESNYDFGDGTGYDSIGHGENNIGTVWVWNGELHVGYDTTHDKFERKKGTPRQWQYSGRYDYSFNGVSTVNSRGVRVKARKIPRELKKALQDEFGKNLTFINFWRSEDDLF